MFHVKQLLFARIAEPITQPVVAVCGVKRSKQTGCVAIKAQSRELPSLWRVAAVIVCKKRRKKEPEEQKLHTAAGYGAMIKVCKIGRKGCVVLKCRKSSGFLRSTPRPIVLKDAVYTTMLKNRRKRAAFLHEMWVVVRPHFAVWKSG